jgi:TAT (twin-arginine translocation) pathway signal sequence
MPARTKRLSRRDFLLVAGAGGAAAAAAVLVKPGPSDVPAKGQGKRASRGYHASEHINNYYRTTKI